MTVTIIGDFKSQINVIAWLESDVIIFIMKWPVKKIYIHIFI